MKYIFKNCNTYICFPGTTYEFTPNGRLGWGWGNFIKKSDILDPTKGFLCDGNSLKLLCQIILNSPIQQKKMDYKRNEDSRPCGSELLSEELKCLSICRDHSDVTLTTKTKSFPSFKCLLAGTANNKFIIY